MSSENEVRLLAFTEEGKENVEAVYKIATEKNLKCIWVTENEVENMTTFKEDVVYVADPIEGPEVGGIIKHLVELKYPVIGPQCALTVLKHGIRLQSDLKYPVYTLSMLDTIVCFSNVMNDEREKLVHFVEMMGGKVSRPLHCDVTHLVVGEVGSVKYFTASSYDIKIVIKDWIYHLWKHGVSRYICAKDGKWEEFLCPVFLGCSVCLTGFGTSEKTRVQKLVTKFGGEYSGAMKLNYTTHLIVNKPEGQKFAMASKFGVKVVNINWVYDSVEKGMCQDNNNYPVKSDGLKKSVNQSTPESHAKISRLESMGMDMSSIDPSMINETVASNINDTSRMSTIGIPSSYSASVFPTPSIPPVQISSTRSTLMLFPLNRDYSDILDGIHVFLSGFLPDEEEKMTKLLSVASAIKYNQLTSTVSHVIIGNRTRITGSMKNEIISISSQNPDLWVISQSWVFESLKNGELATHNEHWETSIIPLPVNQETSDDETRMEATSDSNVITTMKKKLVVRPSVSDRDGSMLGYLLNDVDDNEMLSQYINPQVEHEETEDGGTPDVSDTMHEGSSFMRRNVQRENQDNDLTSMDIDETKPQPNETTEMQSTTMQSESSILDYFADKTFFIFGFDSEEMQQLISEIESCGGQTLPVNSKKIADYAIVPLTGWPVDRTVQEVVTNFWLTLCVEEGRLVDTEEHVMCIPFSVPPDSLPLLNCVACLSKYRDAERVYLSRLVVELGGMAQDILARRDVKDLKKTTHLIINEPGGEKYDGCKNWGIFTVTEQWVYECATKGKKLPEDDFCVDKPRKPKIPRKTLNTENETVSKTSNVLSKVSKLKSNSYVGWNTEFPPMPRPPSVVDKIRKRLEAKADAEKKATEEAIKNKETPLRVRYKRLNLETPSKFMTKGGGPGNVSFDLTEVFELLKTPAEQQKKIRDEIEKNPETPMSEFISRCLDEGISNIPEYLIQNLDYKLDESDTAQNHDDEDCEETKLDESTTKSTIFSNIVISLSKKLHDQFAELGKIISSHGGEFRWTYDNACTHFLFQGKLNDRNKEFLIAKKDGKFVVSPHWVTACAQTNSRLDESLFPHVYDPNKSIQMVSNSPPKTRRRTLRNSTSVNTSTTSGTGTSSSTSATESEDDIMGRKKSRLKKEQEIEVEDSQEARESLRKKLEHIMSATSVAKESLKHRLSCSRVNTPTPSSIVSGQRRAGGTPIPMKNLDHDKTELSQDVQVSWDDPTGREEMERLMKETDNDSTFKIPANITNINSSKSNIEVAQGSISHSEVNEEDADIPMTIKNGQIMRFLMSSVSPQEKTKYSTIITELGGEFLESGFLDHRGTHLLVSKPGRSEKFLSALASGKYIINPQYFIACKEENKFLLEDKYEYGNPSNPTTKQHLEKPDVLQNQISLSAYRWRKKFESNEKESGVRKGAFAGWKVLLHVNERQLKGFERLLQCGSAVVVATQLPQHEKLGDITHAFIDLEKAKELDNSILEELLTRSGIHICNPTYIGDYLLKDPLPEPHTHYLPQVTTILENMDQENDCSRGAKRRKVD